MSFKVSRWFVSLAAKLIKVVPIRTTWVVLFTLIAQVAYIIAFFLPLKIVILLGSEGTPRYFPPSFADIDRNLIVVALSIATFVFFLINVLAEKAIDKVTASATQVLLKRSHKLALFENQDELAATAYRRFSRALAGLVFSVLAITGLLFIYPEMALVMSGFIVVSITLTLAAFAFSQSISAYLQTTLNTFMDYVSAMGFFVVFGFLIVDFVWLQPPNIIVAIIAILLGRQTFSRLSRTVIDMTRLYGQQQKINALFFHGQALLPAIENERDAFWDFLVPENRVIWITRLIREFGEAENISREQLEANLQWLQPAIPQMGTFIYQYDDSTYLIKFYDDQKMVASQHSLTLLSDAPKDLPAPTFIGSSFVQQYPCALYKIKKGALLSRKKHLEFQPMYMAGLLSVIPPKALTEIYLRSHPTLVQRMNICWLDRLHIIVRSDKQQSVIDSLRSNWSRLVELLTELPLAFHNPFIRLWDIWGAQQPDEFIFLNWEKWGIEPAGAGWPTSDLALKSLTQAYPEIIDKRQDLQALSVEYLMLAALVFEFERLMQQNLDKALDVVMQIWLLLESLDVVHANQATKGRIDEH